MVGCTEAITTEEVFKRRTKGIGLRVIRLIEVLPRTKTADVVGRQLLRSATSIGANYRAACRGISTADVISKLGDVEEEADETLYWLELLGESGAVPAKRLTDLMQEVEEVLAMVVASRKTLRSRVPKVSARKRSPIDDKTRLAEIENRKSKIEN